MPVFCAVYDIVKDGRVSNLKLLQSTGDAYLDGVIAKWYEQSQYDPATLNGAPVIVLQLAKYIPGPSPLADNCTWDFYDAHRTSLVPSSPQP